METNYVADGGTRTGSGSRFWKTEWFKNFPTEGIGKFAYQHHWSGLSPEDIKQPESRLLETNKSLHGDLRFEGPHGTWGVSIFLGTTTDNRFSFGDAFINADPSSNLQVSFKSLHDDEWLDGSWADSWHIGKENEGTRFFNLDEGTYSIGVWKQDLFEVFLHGKYLKGRYTIHGVPFGIRKRTFLISRPKNQVPLSEQRTVGAVTEEQISKGSTHLVWCSPGNKPEVINLTKGDDMEKRDTENSRGLNEAETLLMIADRGGERLSKNEGDYYEYFGHESRTCQNCVFFNPAGVDEDGTCRVIKGPIGNEATSAYFIARQVIQPQNDVFSDRIGKGNVIFAKAGSEDEPFGFVLAPILVPEVVDLQGDIVSADEIEKAAHGYMEESQQGGFMHTHELDQDDAVLVESYLVRHDSEIAGVPVAKGTWIGGWRVYNLQLRKLIREGKIRGVSIGGASLGEIEDE